MLREVLAEERLRLTEAGATPATRAALLWTAGRRLEMAHRETLVGVINATGVVIHTNLGRAPLAPAAARAAAEAAGYGNLEFDLEGGKRALRDDHLGGLIGQVTRAEAGFAVNNGAGAVLLTLAALAQGAPVIVSRGELIEIGGGFRVPDIVAQSGSALIEVGTTNRTHMGDYERAADAHPQARVILRTHPSNFRITGFTAAPALAELAAFARERGLILVEDLGGGALVDLEPFGIIGEPMVQASIAAGVDAVIFSGDKLLGGPQAGVIAGRRGAVAAAQRHPLARALRLDKLSLAALAATLRLYRAPSDPTVEIPVLRMLTQPLAAIAARAEALAGMVADALEAEIWETTGYAGGGAMPMHGLPSRALAMARHGLSSDVLARRLRTGTPSVVTRIERDRVLADLRAVADEELPALAAAIREAAG